MFLSSSRVLVSVMFKLLGRLLSSSLLLLSCLFSSLNSFLSRSIPVLNRPSNRTSTFPQLLQVMDPEISGASIVYCYAVSLVRKNIRSSNLWCSLEEYKEWMDVLPIQLICPKIRLRMKQPKITAVWYLQLRFHFHEFAPVLRKTLHKAIPREEQRQRPGSKDNQGKDTD